MMDFIDTIVEPSLWFLADWSLRWVLLIGVAVLVLLVFRPRQAATRQVMLLTALLGGLLLPVAPRWGSGWYAPPNDTLAPPMVPALESSPPGAPHLEKRTVEVHETLPAASNRAASDRAEDPVAVVEAWGSRRISAAGVALCWSAGVVALLLRWGCGWWFLRRLRRSAVVMRGQSADLFAACCTELDVRGGVRLATHPLVRSPILIGLFRPMILIPLDWPRLPVDAQRAGLLHELAHVRRRDHWLASLLHLLRVSFFFHPLVRWLLARLEYERELLCDEMVIQRGIERHDYARMLLDFARPSGRFALPGYFGASYLPIGRHRTIKARIYHLLEENMERCNGSRPGEQRRRSLV